MPRSYPYTISSTPQPHATDSVAAASVDPPSLQALVEDHGGYPNITAEAWSVFDRQMADWKSRVRHGEVTSFAPAASEPDDIFKPTAPAETIISFCVESYFSGGWQGNDNRFATVEEANAFALNLKTIWSPRGFLKLVTVKIARAPPNAVFDFETKDHEYLVVAAPDGEVL